MTAPVIPSWETFRALPLAAITPLAPATMIYQVAGTRRSAALAGVPEHGEAYAEWQKSRLITCLEVVARQGVRHVLMPLLTASQFSEVTADYHDKLWGWLEYGLTGDAMLAAFQQHNWRVRFLFADQRPALQRINARLAQATPHTTGPRIWFYVTPEPNQLWQWMLARFQTHLPATPAEAITTLYGEAIPPATLLLDFGKLSVSPDLLPPFLFSKLHCYWTQRPGYRLDDEQFRAILYDYAYLRPTWQADKTGRAAAALAHRAEWERGPIIGLGQRFGPHWYPQLNNPIT
jgi:hypothetical protein